MKLTDSQLGKTSDNFYRLGDALLNTRARLARRQMLNNPNTIGYDYLKNSGFSLKHELKSSENITGDKLNTALLNSIIDEYTNKNKYEMPDDNTLVIHWRLYPNRPVSVTAMAEKINLFSYDKVVIVSAIRDVCTNGRENEIFDFMKGYNATIKSSQSADEDFVYCVKAKKFIGTIGNFSKLAYIMNTADKQMCNE